MLQYLVILLDDTSTSFCHYENVLKGRNLIPLDTLRQAVCFAMKENLMVQFVYPDYKIPEEYDRLIDMVEHSSIKPFAVGIDKADVIVYEGADDFCSEHILADSNHILRIGKDDLFQSVGKISDCLGSISRLNIIITDVQTFTESDFSQYRDTLKVLSDKIEKMYLKGCNCQVNVLTDRLSLEGMNNCGAGDTTVTLAPDGYFYICPAFYQVNEGESYGLGPAKIACGSIDEGVQIKNQRLYGLHSSPICCKCDAFQCKRCVWLNRSQTYEVNTPGKEQCIVSHIERNASRDLMLRLNRCSDTQAFVDIPEIDYLDPLELIINPNKYQ